MSYRIGKRNPDAASLTPPGALAAGSSVVIDKSGNTQAFSFAVTTGKDGLFSALVTGADGTKHTYGGIGDLTAIGTIFDDSFVVDATPVASGATLKLDGEAGTDSLSIDFSALSVDLSTDANGTLSGVGGTFSNFETVAIKLGNGADQVSTGASADTIDASAGGDDRISTGAGNDRISIGATGTQAIDGGDGSDVLVIAPVKTHDRVVAVLDASQHTILGATYSGIESFGFDVRAATPFTLVVRGDLEANPLHIFYPGGSRTIAHLTLDFDGSSLAGPMTVDAGTPEYDNNVPSTFSLSIESGATHFFSGYSTVATIVGTSADDTFSFAGPPPGGPFTLNWNGGAGTDLLTFDLRDPSYGDVERNNLRFVVQADGTVDCNYATFANFERYVVIAGTGSFVVGGDLGDHLSGQGVFYGKGGDDELYGTYVDGGAGDDDLTGTTAAYEDAESGVVVRVATGAQDTIGAGIDTLHGIVNLVGSAFADRLTGDERANVIEGGLGNDQLDGGAGIDTASYAGATAGVSVNLAITGEQDTVSAGRDTLASIENLLGSAFADVLSGDAGDNVLNGGDGIDTASYADVANGVTVDLRILAAQDTGNGRDTLASIENLLGGAFDDTLSGDLHDNVIEGGAGNDILDGSTGYDTARYAGATAGVTVSLAITTAQDTGGAGIDTLANFEALSGSAFDDVLTGGRGDDRLIGGAGNDTLIGSTGSDELRGADGDHDVAAYLSGKWSDYDVTRVGDHYAIASRALPYVDTAYGIEYLSFANGTFAIGDTVNVGPKALVDRVTGLVEAVAGDRGTAKAHGNVLANDRDANLSTAGLGEHLSVDRATAGGAAQLTDVDGKATLQGKFGTLTISENGNYTYKLDHSLPATDRLRDGQIGRDIFTYEVTDAHGATSHAQLKIFVEGTTDTHALQVLDAHPAFAAVPDVILA